MNKAPIIAELRKECRRLGGQAAAARELGGFSRSYICRVLNGQRQPNNKLLRALGFRVVVEPTNGS